MEISINTDRDYNAAKNTLEGLWATGRVQELYGFKPEECPMIRALKKAIKAYLLEACHASVNGETTKEQEDWIANEVSAENLGKLGIDADDFIEDENSTPEWL